MSSSYQSSRNQPLPCYDPPSLAQSIYDQIHAQPIYGSLHESNNDLHARLPSSSFAQLSLTDTPPPHDLAHNAMTFEPDPFSIPPAPPPTSGASSDDWNEELEACFQALMPESFDDDAAYMHPVSADHPAFAALSSLLIPSQPPRHSPVAPSANGWYDLSSGQAVSYNQPVPVTTQPSISAPPPTRGHPSTLMSTDRSSNAFHAQPVAAHPDLRLAHGRPSGSPPPSNWLNSPLPSSYQPILALDDENMWPLPSISRASALGASRPAVVSQTPWEEWLRAAPAVPGGYSQINSESSHGFSPEYGSAHQSAYLPIKQPRLHISSTGSSTRPPPSAHVSWEDVYRQAHEASACQAHPDLALSSIASGTSNASSSLPPASLYGQAPASAPAVLRDNFWQIDPNPTRTPLAPGPSRTPSLCSSSSSNASYSSPPTPTGFGQHPAQAGPQIASYAPPDSMSMAFEQRAPASGPQRTAKKPRLKRVVPERLADRAERSGPIQCPWPDCRKTLHLDVEWHLTGHAMKYKQTHGYCACPSPRPRCRLGDGTGRRFAHPRTLARHMTTMSHCQEGRYGCKCDSPDCKSTYTRSDSSHRGGVTHLTKKPKTRSNARAAGGRGRAGKGKKIMSSEDIL